MPTDNHWANRAIQHARHLADRIGPRGANTPEEKRAADYVLAQLQASGVSQARSEPFRAGRSGWLPVAMVFSMAVWGSLICWAGFYLTSRVAPGALIGAVLCLLAAWLIYRHFTFRSYPLRRWLARESSQNIVGRIPSVEAAKQRVVLVANLDTPPDAWVFRTPRRARLFRLLLTLAGVSLAVSVIMFVLGALEAWSWAFIVATICGFVQGSGVLLAIQADQGDYSPDANTTGSALGAWLALATELVQTPLRQTEVWLVAGGSQTSDNSGLRAFIDQHHGELDQAWFIGFERVGVGDQIVSVNNGGRVQPNVQKLLDELEIPQGPHRPIGLPTPIEAARIFGYRALCLSVHVDRPLTSASQLQISAFQSALQTTERLLQHLDK